MAGESMQRDYWYTLGRAVGDLESPEAVGRKAAERTVARLGARRISTRKAPVLYVPELALGFVGPQRTGLLEQLGVELDGRGNVARDEDWQTSAPNVFCCGDMGRGQSLIVWAIAEGRSCAASVDRHLMGDSLLPSPVSPTLVALR